MITRNHASHAASPWRETASPRCPQCHQPLNAKPTPVVPVAPVKRYALETRFGVRRMNGGFV